MADGSPGEYQPVMSPGRELYERWLSAKRTPPDDHWDHLPEEGRIAWEELASSIADDLAGEREAKERLRGALAELADNRDAHMVVKKDYLARAEAAEEARDELAEALEVLDRGVRSLPELPQAVIEECLAEELERARVVLARHGRGE